MKITEETLSDIENIFEFKLYKWQKEYLLGKTDQRIGGRNNGKTFAYCIKLLLSDGNKIKWDDVINGKYIDEYHEGTYKRWFARFIRDINEQLVSAGFETRLDLKN